MGKGGEMGTVSKAFLMLDAQNFHAVYLRTFLELRTGEVFLIDSLSSYELYLSSLSYTSLQKSKLSI
jgi:hypothetical protein